MAARKKSTGGGKIRGVLELAELSGEPRPELRLELVDSAGGRRVIEVGDEGAFELDEKLVGKDYMVELTAEEGGPARRFRYDTFAARVRQEGTYVLPRPSWELLFPVFRCVTGSVTVCKPWWNPWDILRKARLPLVDAQLTTIVEQLDPSAIGPFLPIHPQICSPVCQGKVEIFLRTCCCPYVVEPEIPEIVIDLCEIIGCPPIPWPPWPRPWPEPGPWPGPGPGPDPGPLEQATAHALKEAFAEEGPDAAARVLRAGTHLRALTTLAPAQQIEYVRAYPELRYWRCICRTNKVAEVPLEEDGNFDACFPVGRPGRGCRQTVLYRVSQLQGTSWVTIYDGPARGEEFELDEPATLWARPNAEACETPHDWDAHPTPFVILEQIGNTWADTLIHSTQQVGETAFGGPLGPKDGLANAAPTPAPPIDAGPYDQPWATTLNLRYQFHPGLAGLGAVWYRVRVIPIGPNGQPLPGGGAFELTNGVSWRKYAPDGAGGVKVEWHLLNAPGPVGGVTGLYRIPYPDLVWPWLGGQWHAFVDTRDGRMPDGAYLFVIDVFDAAGKRLVPSNTTDPAVTGDVQKAFVHRRLDGPIDAAFANTSVVPHNALANLFWVDNLPCYGRIEGLVHNGALSASDCQFLEGPATDTFAVRYSARQTNGFQWYHSVTVKKGLFGTAKTLQQSAANVTNGLTPSKQFKNLLPLATDVPPPTPPDVPQTDMKCAFTINLAVRTRHTNGMGTILAYEVYENGAFALERTT